MNAEEIMTKDPMTVNTNARICDAMQILQTLEVRHLPVLDERGALVGMVSDRDLRRTSGLTEEGGGVPRKVLEQSITNIMSSDVHSIGPETELSEVIDLLLELKIGALPVVDDHTGDLCGIVSYVDVLRHARTLME